MEEILQGTVGALHILAADSTNRAIIHSLNCTPMFVRVSCLRMLVCSYSKRRCVHTYVFVRTYMYVCTCTVCTCTVCVCTYVCKILIISHFYSTTPHVYNLTTFQDITVIMDLHILIMIFLKTNTFLLQSKQNFIHNLVAVEVYMYVVCKS